MARVTISDLQRELQNVRDQLATQQQINRELREEMATIRSVASIAMTVLEKVLRS